MSTQRTITVVATKGGRIEKVTTDVSTWGDLQMLIQNSYDLKNLKAVENVGKTTLEHIDAVLPAGDFRLFLRPSKTKSGGDTPDFKNMSFGDLKDFIKANEDAKEHLNTVAKKSGRNWTQLKTEERKEALISFYKKSKKNDAKAPVQETQTEEVVSATEEVVETATTQKVLNPLEKILQAKALLESAVADIEEDEDFTDTDEVSDIAYEMYDEFESIITICRENNYSADENATAQATPAPVEESEADKQAREEKARQAEEKAKQAEADRLEREDIEREARELGEGF